MSKIPMRWVQAAENRHPQRGLPFDRRGMDDGTRGTDSAIMWRIYLNADKWTVLQWCQRRRVWGTHGTFDTLAEASTVANVLIAMYGAESSFDGEIDGTN